jgi:hypothetical protein
VEVVIPASGAGILIELGSVSSSLHLCCAGAFDKESGFTGLVASEFGSGGSVQIARGGRPLAASGSGAAVNGVRGFNFAGVVTCGEGSSVEVEVAFLAIPAAVSMCAIASMWNGARHGEVG